MEYRQLPHGTEREKFGVLGLGLGGIGKTPADEIEAIISAEKCRAGRRADMMKEVFSHALSPNV